MKRQIRVIKASIFKQPEASRFFWHTIHPKQTDKPPVAFHTDFVVACKRILSIQWIAPE